ncbi:MAG: ABC transporter substrate-binding protein [Proteobacteria bacterium]|nr:ABC transporter substrate-binding protein [Pseudomonadota bacterium]
MRLKTILFLLISAIVISSCSKKEEKVLNIYSRQKIQFLEPARISSIYEERIARQIYETLYEFNYLKDPYKLIPLIAANLPQINRDKLTYTIKIKQGVKFADDPCFKNTNGKGRTVNARDFIYSLKYFAASPSFHKAYFMYYIDGLIDFRRKAKEAYKKGQTLTEFIKTNEVKGLKADDEYTLSIRIVQPCTYFLETITIPEASIVPIEALEYYGANFNVHPVGTGPFILKELNKNNETVLVRNPNYTHSQYPTEATEEEEKEGLLKDTGKPLPLVDKIVVRHLKTDRERQSEFDKGKLDIYSPEHESLYEYFPKNKELSKEYRDIGTKVTQIDNTKFTGILFNMNDPLIGKNKYLRQAIVNAFDNAKNIDVFFYERPITAYWIIPPHVFGYDPNYKSPYVYNISEAKKALSRAGYPNGKGLPEIIFLLEEDPLMHRIGKFFEESMSKIGINVKLEFVDNPEKINQTVEDKKNHIHLFMASGYSIFSSPEVLLRLFYKGRSKYKTNYSGYYNQEYEKLCDKVSLMEDGPEKLKTLNRMRDIIINDHVVIPMSFSVLYRLYYDYVQNYKPHVMMFDRYKYLNIDTEEKYRVLKRLSNKR